MKPSDVPFVRATVRPKLDNVWIQQVIGRAVVAMLLLNAKEERELVLRPEMQFEWGKPWPAPVVHTLGIFAALPARLPISFQHRAAAIIKGCELGGRQRCRAEQADQRH